MSHNDHFMAMNGNSHHHPSMPNDDSGMDHMAGMNHGDHDMNHMDHGEHSMGHMSHMMSMNFHFGTEETVLFSFWKFTTVGGLIGSMIGIFILAVLYEGLKYYREHLFWRAYSLLQYRSVPIPADKTPLPPEAKVTHMCPEVEHRDPPLMFSKHHMYQTVLHVVQVIVSYFLMLIFMTFNVWLGLAVALGSTTGFFLFGWKKSVVVDVTEHCH